MPAVRASPVNFRPLDLAKRQKVLEVGVDQNGSLISRIAHEYKAAEALGINLVTHDYQISSNCRVMSGDIRKTNFEDSYFDILISSSVFEHVHNLDAALDEMYRIMKPGGVLFSHFGPIWSTSYGHHLWLRHKGKLYNYWNFVLPPYCHLITPTDELLEHCLTKTSDVDLSKAIVEYVYHSKHQNQLMYEDYDRLITNSKFERIFFKGYDASALTHLYTTPDFPKVTALLKARFPNYHNFLYDGITLVVRKPE